MIDHNYLSEQFADRAEILADISRVVGRGDFTLGREVAEFEAAFAKLTDCKHAIGVANGTDALFLLCKFLLPGEIIVPPFTFPATVAAIVNAGHRPVFVDVGRDFNIDAAKIEAAITLRTVAILPVHWAGRQANMFEIGGLAEKRGLVVIEDACQAICATSNGHKAGSMSLGAAFSLHPLKNLNIWGDGGVITTNDDALAAWLRKARNHGFEDRNTVSFWGWNSRLDTLQAVVGLHVMAKLPEITAARRRNAAALDAALCGIPGVEVLPPPAGVCPSYHIYPLHAERRNDLVAHLLAHGVDAKVHYPVPLHLQPAAASLGYKKGDFQMAEWCADSTLSLPVHEFVTPEDIETMAKLIKGFYE